MSFAAICRVEPLADYKGVFKPSAVDGGEREIE